MKIAILGDLHFGVRNDSHVFLDHQQKFFDEVFFPTLKERRIDFHIQMGDLMDRRKSVNYHTLSRAKRMYFDRLFENEITGLTLVGNHDIYWRQSIEINAWNELFEEAYGDIYEGVWSPKTIDLDGRKCDIIPWICDENEKEIFDFIKKSDSTILFGHLELSGFPMLRGVLSQHGYDKNIFSKYEQVFSGHYHTFSQKGNVLFTGVPYELTWADFNDPKYFFIWDTETLDIEKIENPYNLFQKIVYNEDEIDLKKFPYKEYNNTYIRVIVQKKENDKKFERFIERLYNQGLPIDLQITDVTLAYRDVDIDNIETKDPLQVMIQAIEDSDRNPDMKADIKRMAMELHTEAISKTGGDE